MRETHTPRASLRRDSNDSHITSAPAAVPLTDCSTGCSASRSDTRSVTRNGLTAIVGAFLVLAALATAAPVLGVAGDEVVGDLPDANLLGYWYTVANGDRVNQVLHEDSEVWSATDGGGVVHWSLSDSSYRQYLSPQDGLPSNEVRALLRHSDGALYAATSNGLAVLEAGGARWRTVDLDESTFASPSMSALTQDPDGTIWVGMEQRWDAGAPHPVEGKGAFVGGGLAHFDPVTGAWTQVARAELTEDPNELPLGLPSDNVTSVAIGSDGLLWVGTRPYYRWRDDKCSRPPCPPMEWVWDQDGGGLAATDDPANGWRHWNSKVDNVCVISTDHVTDLLTDENRRMWVSSPGGLQLYMNGLGTRLCNAESGHRYWKESTSDLPGSQVWSMHSGADNRVWMSVGNNERGLGVAVLDHGGTFEPPGESPDEPTDDTWVLHDLFGYEGKHDAVPVSIQVLELPDTTKVVIGTRDDRRGDGWGVLLADLQRLDSWESLRTSDNGPSSNQITVVADDPTTNAVWFGTRNRGVARWDGSTWSSWGAFEPARSAGALLSPGARSSEAISLTLTVDEFNQAFAGPMRLMSFIHDRTVYELGPARQVDGGVRAAIRPKLQKSYPTDSHIQALDRAAAGDEVTSIAVDDDGHVWIGAMPSTLRPAAPGSAKPYCETYPDCWYDGGVGTFDGEAWTTFNPTPGGGNAIHEVQALAFDSRGHLWAGSGDPGSDSGQGAIILDPANETWEVRSRASEGSEFGGDVVTGVAVDPLTGDVWLSTHHGRCSPQADDCPTTGRIGGGVSRYDGRNWTRWVHSEDSDLTASGEEGNFTGILFDLSRSRIWAGAWTRGDGELHWISGKGIDSSVNVCPRNCRDANWSNDVFTDEGPVSAMAVDDAGRMWLGSSRENRGIIPHPGGVKLLDGDAWVRQSTDLWSHEVTALGAQGDGMWLGTYDGGAARWRPAELRAGAYLPVLGR